MIAIVEQLLHKPRYNIPEHLRQKVLDEAEAILTDGQDSSLKIKAMRVILEADKRNLDIARMLIPQMHIQTNVKNITTEELLRIAKDNLKLLPVIDTSITTPSEL